MNKAERLNREMAYLVNHPAFHLADLMEQFHISRRTALRDITDLVDLGLNIDTEPGRYGGYQVTNRGTLIPMTFTGNEVSAILFAIKSLALVSVNPFQQSYPNIYERLLSTLPSYRRKSVTDMMDACHYYNVPPLYEIPFLRQVLKACISRQVIEITSSQLGKEPVRVQFLWIFYRNGFWFFEGIDADRGRWYRARCDLITAFSDTGKKGKLDREALQAQHDRFVAEHHTIPFRCRITDKGKERYYKERYENIELRGNELVGAYHEDEFAYMLDYLIGYGSQVVILEPESLRRAYRQRLQAMLAAAK